MNKKLNELLNVKYPKDILLKSIPIFSPRTEEQREDDKYDMDFKFVDWYAGLYAYVHITLQHGGCESLYRTINSIILSHFSKEQEYNFLDIGCGVGRTLYDLAELFPNSFFVGMDYAYNMLERANQILFSGKKITVDLSNDGFGKLEIPSKNLSKNVTLIQADAMNLPFKQNVFDCVLNTFLIDRLPDPIKSIQQSIEVLKPNGLFIITDPLNFTEQKLWNSIGSFEKVCKAVEDNGIEIIEAFDNLAYKQLLDVRGNYRDWKTFVIYGIKK